MQIQALEQGIEPELVGRRIAMLRADKDKAEDQLRELGLAAPTGTAAQDASELLARVPNRVNALRAGPPELKRQVFDAFGVSIRYDRADSRLEIVATISESLARTLENRSLADAAPSADDAIDARLCVTATFKTKAVTPAAARPHAAALEARRRSLADEEAGAA